MSNGIFYSEPYELGDRVHLVDDETNKVYMIVGIEHDWDTFIGFNILFKLRLPNSPWHSSFTASEEEIERINLKFKLDKIFGDSVEVT